MSESQTQTPNEIQVEVTETEIKIKWGTINNSTKQQIAVMGRILINIKDPLGYETAIEYNTRRDLEINIEDDNYDDRIREAIQSVKRELTNYEDSLRKFATTLNVIADVYGCNLEVF